MFPDFHRKLALPSITSSFILFLFVLRNEGAEIWRFPCGLQFRTQALGFLRWRKILRSSYRWCSIKDLLLKAPNNRISCRLTQY
jgi:hypothetical protein